MMLSPENQSILRAPAATLTLETYSRTIDVEREWRRLETVGFSTVFQRYDWVDAYSRHVMPHEHTRPAIVLGRLDGEPAFILPFAISKVGPARIATWIGGRHSGYNFGLWHPRAVEAMASLGRDSIEKMLAGALPDVDCALLARVPRIHDGMMQPLAALARRPSPTEGYSFALPEDFAATLKRADGSARGRKIRKKERYLADAGSLFYGTAQDTARAHAALDFFFEQKAGQLAEQGKVNGFAEPGVRNFFHDLIERSQGMQEPLLEMTELSVDGKTRAAFGAGIHRGRLNGYFMAFARDDLERHSPGSVLLFRHVEECCARGLNAYDLGVGYERYKTQWCDIVHELDDVYAAFTSVGSAVVAMAQLGQAMKAQISRNASLWKGLKTVQAFLARRQLI